MRLSEIMTIDSDGFRFDYNQNVGRLRNAPIVHQTAMPAFDLKSIQDSEELLLALFEKQHDNLVSAIRLIHDGEYWQVVMIYTDPDFRGRKLMKFLLDTSVKILGPVISDSRQTPDATAFWKSVISSTPPLKVSALNRATGEKHPLRGPEAVDPWADQDEEIVILAEDMRTGYTPQMLERHERLDQKRIEAGRITNWYGPDKDPYNV